MKNSAKGGPFGNQIRGRSAALSPNADASSQSHFPGGTTIGAPQGKGLVSADSSEQITDVQNKTQLKYTIACHTMSIQMEGTGNAGKHALS